MADTYTDTYDDLYGDPALAFPYLADLSVIVDDDRRLVNVAKVNRQDGRDQVVEDAASIAAYGRRAPANLDGLLFATDKQSRSVAEWLIYTRAEPEPRVDRIAFSPVTQDSDLVPFACLVEPGYLVTVERGDVSLDAHVVDVGHRIGLDHWEVELVLDGSRANRSWFTWGTSNWGGADGWAF